MWLAFGLLVRAAAAAEPEVTVQELPRFPAVEPVDAFKTFQIKKGFKLEFAAHEPQVVDPIALSFDEFGRMFVVEMIDYSERRDAKPHLGRIRRLEDKDGDGFFESSTVYANDLPWPTALMCYGGGLFVGATPDIIWFKDTDGDGKADVREVVFTGLGSRLERPNVQSQPNCFNWGLDNRIHLQCGAGGRGTLRCLKRPDLKSVELNAQDLWFDPRAFDFGLEAGGGQYGFSYDTCGRKFVCNNSDHLRLFLYDDRYAARNPYYSMPPPLRSIAADGGAAEVFRISPDEPWRIIRTRWRVAGVVKGIVEGGGRVSGYFTGATGTMVYRGDAYGPAFVNNTFTGDAGGNLVHRKILYPDGVGFIGKRPDDEQKFEFLASRDTWFRPVNFANAPDGCLYVIDMYREVIEHPWSIPESIKQHLDLNSGNDRGRIYRIVPERWEGRHVAGPNIKDGGTPSLPRRKVNLGNATTVELVATLEHPNGWHRDTAARLLYERQDGSAVTALTRLLNQSRSPEGRMHALHVLDGLNALKEAHLLQALGDSVPCVREHAALLSGQMIKQGAASDKLVSKLKTLTTDPDARVRFQLAFTLGEVKQTERAAALADIARRDGDNAWIAAAVLSAPAGITGELFARLSRDAGFVASPAGDSFLRQLVQVIGAKNDAVEISAVLSFVSQESPSAALVRALGDGLHRAGSSLAQADKEGRLKGIFAGAAATAADAMASESKRTQAIALLGLTSFKDSGAALAACLRADEPVPIQLAAVAALGSFGGAGVSEPLLHDWPAFSPRVRSETLSLLLARPERALALLDAIESGFVKRDQLNSTQIESLQKHKDKRVVARALMVLPPEKKVSRDEIIAQFSTALGLKGDAAKGRAIYIERCISCHRTEGQGFQLGPDLVTVKTAGREKLLTNILDPNKEVAPQYLAYVIETKDGESYSGLIANDDASGVALRQAFGKEDLIPRANIKTMRSPGLSLMPEGLEAGLTLPQMADLLEFIESLK